MDSCGSTEPTPGWTQVCVSIPTPKVVEEMAKQLYDDTVAKHPIPSALALLAWSYFPEVPFQIIYIIFLRTPHIVYTRFLNLLGFTKDGVAPNSFASHYQSYVHGGYTPQDSLFSRQQSYGALEEWRRAYQLHRADAENLMAPERTHERGRFMKGFSWTLFFFAIAILLNTLAKST